MREPIRLAILTLISLPLLQCGGKKARSYAAAEFEVLPKEPIVILGKTKDDKDNDIEGPWFGFRLKVSNSDSEEAITIVAVSLDIMVPGETSPRNVTFAASDFNRTVALDADTSVECKYFYFDSIPSKTKDQILSLGGSDPVCGGKVPYFLVGNLGLKDVGATYRFTVRARPMGWFGDGNNPTDRFDMKFSFATK